MKKQISKKSGVVVLAFLVVGITSFGCSQGVQDDANNAGKTLSTDASKAGKSLSATGEKVKVALTNDETSASVSGAIGQAKDLKVADLKVDTSGTVVTIQGYVDSQADHQRAVKIAKDLLGSKFTLDDKLKVAVGH